VSVLRGFHLICDTNMSGHRIILVCHRGCGCLCPCVRCPVPLEELYNLLFHAPLRDPKLFVSLLRQSSQLGITAARELLKSQGYRPVQVRKRV
jgi:hypothetical protein